MRLAVLSLISSSIQHTQESSKTVLPKDFIWGAATSAFQVEGATHIDGRKDSIWDTFQRLPRKISRNESADVSANHYKLFPEDIRLMAKYRMSAYRFSLSWSRIIPNGHAGSPVNQLAIDHYNRVLDMLLSNGITPLVTLYHWDLPQTLQESYGGLTNVELFTKDFVYYADVVFKAFGDRIKYWMTFNEPHTYCILGYSSGGPFAPGRCSDRSKCFEGNDSTEPWLCGHATLLAHANTANLYRIKYAKSQKGKISIVLNMDWSEPLDWSSESDQQAAQRKRDFDLGWFADPIYKTGNYPESMRKQLGGWITLLIFRASSKVH